MPLAEGTQPSETARLDSYNPALNDLGLRSARAVVPLLISLTTPTSVIDLGCGPGNWLAAFRERGIFDVLGIDQNDYTKDLQIPRDSFRVANLTLPFQSERTFDLVVCMEVAEHLPRHSAPTLVRSLTALGKVIVFSAAIPFQGGTDHRNEQWPEYWCGLFDAHGFVPVDCIRPRIWLNEEVAWWYRQNMVLYVEREYLAASARLRAEVEHPPVYPLALVHPALYEMKPTAAPSRQGPVLSALHRVRQSGMLRILRSVIPSSGQPPNSV